MLSIIRMGCAIIFMLAVSCDCNLLAQTGSIGPSPDSLSVLYAGKPGSDRTQQFESFLGQHFKKVATCDLSNFIRSDADGFDVVVFDWPYTSPRDRADESNTERGQPFNVDTYYSRPTVMIGYAAGIYTSSYPMAIDWKCLCLENYAHDVNSEHPIFKGPLKVDINYESVQKPEDYYFFPGTASLDERMQAWKIQNKTFPEVAPGLVSSRENFLAASDSEAISGGANGKGPSSVAVGRHGNFLLWGFSAAPVDMTDSAKNALINSICYMKAFDGKRPGKFTANFKTPQNYLAMVYHLRMGSDAYIAHRVKNWDTRVKNNELTPEQIAIVGSDPAAYFRKSYERTVQQIFNQIPESVRKQTGDDVEKIIAYYTDHADHLHVNDMGEFDITHSD